MEKSFQTFKSVLDAGLTHLQDNIAAFGHVFVTFLSMYMVANPEDRIKRVGLFPGCPLTMLLSSTRRHVRSDWSPAPWTMRFRRGSRSLTQSWKLMYSLFCGVKVENIKRLLH